MREHPVRGLPPATLAEAAPGSRPSIVVVEPAPGLSLPSLDSQRRAASALGTPTQTGRRLPPQPLLPPQSRCPREATRLERCRSVRSAGRTRVPAEPAACAGVRGAGGRFGAAEVSRAAAGSSRPRLPTACVVRSRSRSVRMARAQTLVRGPDGAPACSGRWALASARACGHCGGRQRGWQARSH